MLFEIENIGSLPKVASEFLKFAGPHRHFALYGPMGVGKTTFIKEVCRQLRVKEMVTSPTFALVNEYSMPDGGKVYHFDFYRIKNEEELYDLGYEDYVYSNEYCFIEWPEKAPGLIPPHFKHIRLQETDSGNRRMEVDLEEIP
jgi:tRNA threonylcarbamoyladenosine biosynthesis protein TsaE